MPELHDVICACCLELVREQPCPACARLCERCDRPKREHIRVESGGWMGFGATVYVCPTVVFLEKVQVHA